MDYPSRGSGGTLATAGNLVIQGTVNQTVAVYRADTGAKLWEMAVQTIPVAGPISYSVDGEQYIALSAGFGGGNAMLQEIRTTTSRKRADGRLLVFKLGGTAQLPPLDEAVPLPPGPPAVPRVGEEVIEHGNALYHRICAGCHGIRAVEQRRDQGSTPHDRRDARSVRRHRAARRARAASAWRASPTCSAPKRRMPSTPT